MTGSEFLKQKLSWAKSSDPLHPFRTQVEGRSLTIRLNDFPEEPMYSLLVNGESVADFDDWPKNWSRPE